MKDWYKDLYDKMHLAGNRHSLKYNGIMFVHLLLQQKTFESVLDVGCGLGGGVIAFLKHGKKAMGLDVCTFDIEYMRKKKLPCIQASAISIPLPDQSYDLICACDFMEHLKPEDVPIALHEFVRVGRKIIALQIGLKEAKGNHPRQVGYDFDNQHLTIWSAEQWESVLRSLGWCITLFTKDIQDGRQHEGKLLWVILEKREQ